MNHFAQMLTVLIVICLSGLFHAQEIGFIEDYALAADRGKALNRLVPGTEDYYYYRSLYHQSRGEYDRVDELLRKWIAEHRETNRFKIIQNRQMLLQFDADSDATFEYLQTRLNLNFNHQRRIPSTERRLPSELDQNLISVQRLTETALKRYQDLSGFGPTGLRHVADRGLNEKERRHLLSRLEYPDYPSLVDIIVKDLQNSKRKFGEYKIHSRLTISQLESCLNSIPRLIDNSSFVNAYLSKLAPSDDVNWRSDSEEHLAYLQRLKKFTGRLNPVFNSLKACIQFRLLDLNRRQGIYDRELFFEYLKLPRNVNYINRNILPSDRRKQSHVANLNTSYKRQTGLAPIRNDYELVVDYLSRFLIDAQNLDAFSPYIKDGVLEDIFASTKLLNGIGDKEVWASKLSQTQFRQLQDRVEIDFALTNREQFVDGEKVSVSLYTKNVPSMIVKLYEINELNYYRKYKKEIDTDILLDGLVPNSERSYTYEDEPILRKKREFNFDELTENGVYVIDFIGGGKSSRALIRRGRLSVVSKTTVAGHLFYAFDHNNKPVSDAELWIDGIRYVSSDDGSIVVPFSNSPGQKVAIVSSGTYSSLQTVYQHSEQYSLNAGIYVDRESLLFNQKCQVLIRPAVSVSGHPASAKLMDNAFLNITSVNHDNVSTTKRINDLEFDDGGETVCEFVVPPRLKSITFEINGEVENVSQNRIDDLSFARSFIVNQIDMTDEIQDVHLLPTDQGYFFEVRGKTGEARSQQAARVRLQHRDFKDPVLVDLESDDDGRIFLGELTGIVDVAATVAGGSERSWPIGSNGTAQSKKINSNYGTDVTVAAPSHFTDVSSDKIALLEVRQRQFVADHFDKVILNGRRLVLENLNPGNYVLRFKDTNQKLDIAVADGEIEFGVILGDRRRCEVRDSSPLVVDDIDIDGKKIRIQLGNSGNLARVHVFASRFQPRFDSFKLLSQVRDIQPWTQNVSARHSAYVAGRKLSDEYQYILNRRYETTYPGNMLTRPSLLINPWAVRDTTNRVESLTEGEEFDNAGVEEDSLARQPGGAGHGGIGSYTDFANLNFLKNQSILISNLLPNENGVVEIDQSKLNGMHHLRIVALNPVSTVQHELSLRPDKLARKDLRLANGLDPDEHFAQFKQIEVLSEGDSITIEDLLSGRFHYFDDLGDVFRLFQSLNPNTRIANFEFLLSWSAKTRKEKQALYSKFACHELNFYLYKKDRDFFDRVVAPHLSSKLEQGFIDDFLLDQALQEYTDNQWRFQKLNVFERILLARGSEDHAANIRRNIDDLYLLNPVKREFFDRLYNKSIRGGELSLESLVELDEESNRDSLPELGTAGLKPALRRGVTSKKMERGRRLAGGGGGGFGGRPGNQVGRKGVNIVAGENSDDAKKRYRSAGRKMAEQEKVLLGMEMTVEKKDAVFLQRMNDKAGADFAVDEYYFGARFQELRKNTQSLYRRLPTTREWIEQQYYQIPLDRQTSDLVRPNRFWKDYSSHKGDSFLSKYFAESHRTLTEMLFALAVMDLPEQSPEHQFEYADNSLKLTAKGKMVAMHQQFRPVEFKPQNTSILISENFFQKNDRYRNENGIRYDKFVKEEFHAHTLYGTQVVVTNPTSTPQAIDLLVQIPRGSVATSGSQDTRSMQFQLNGFSTKTVEYFFYFPTAGDFSHYPAHVSREDEVLAVAENQVFSVVDEPKELDRSSWEYVSQNGSEDDVIDFLRTRNVFRFDLGQIAFRMKNGEFFKRVISTLNSRFCYNHLLWSYGLKHRDANSSAEFLRNENQITHNVGHFFECSLLNIEPYDRNWYQHREYSPLVNARVHHVGSRREILNPDLHAQYHKLLEFLSNRVELTSEDHLVVTYYMLLQDRIQEAIEHFGKVEENDLNEKMQYDYCDAYLDFYLENPEAAASKARKWAEYPVDQWRRRFENILAQVDEIKGSETTVVDQQDIAQKQSKMASEAASFDFKVEAGTVSVSTQSISKLTVNYYEMDIELMFSSSPFELKNLGRFSVIKPTLSTQAEVGSKSEFEFEVPKRFANKNILVEIRAGDQVKAKPYFANTMSVQTIEKFGQLHVMTDKQKSPITKAYVKVFSKSADGIVRFHKDGYTDLRGRFDYVSQSNNQLDGIETYSILVLSPEHGAVTRQVNPPAE